MRLALGLCLALAACSGGEASGFVRDGSEPADSAAESAAPGASSDAGEDRAPAPPAPPAVNDVARRACIARRDARLRDPALPGAASFEARRAEFVGRVRGTPVLFRRPPERRGASSDVLAEAEELASSAKPLAAVRALVNRHARDPERLRAIVLREGYLYADDVDLATPLVETLRITHLFREPTVYLKRGTQLHKLRFAARDRLHPARYLHDDGPLAGDIAELLHADRIGADPAPLEADPLVVDLAEAAHHAGFDRLRPVHLTASALVADVRYGPDVWVPAVFDLDGARARVGCSIESPELAASAQRFRDESAPARAALDRIRAAVRDAVREELKFDEPQGEPDGEQQDGSLRREWRRAYDKGLRKYEVNDRAYPVYDPQGRPIPPEVCIDFITDTWERASGTWFRPAAVAADGRLDPSPARVLGGLRFDPKELENRRSVASFVRFARSQEASFEVWDIPAEERIPLLRRKDFFDYLAAHADDVRPGDVLVIHGLKSDGRPHYHSVLVLEADPITGVPVLVAGNSARPRTQTLEGVMQISPKRSLKHRIRPRASWLASAIMAPPDHR
jgi:hypothetical protein